MQGSKKTVKIQAYTPSEQSIQEKEEFIRKTNPKMAEKEIKQKVEDYIEKATVKESEKTIENKGLSFGKAIKRATIWSVIFGIVLAVLLDYNNIRYNSEERARRRLVRVIYYYNIL